MSLVLPQKKGEQSWLVESISGCNPDGYTVIYQHTTCPECSPQSQHDGVTCTAPECQFLCPHMYTCDKKCYDFNNGHICKHIHKVHSLVVKIGRKLKGTQSLRQAQPQHKNQNPPLTRKTWRIPTLWWFWDCVRRIHFQSRERLVTITYYSNSSNPPLIWTPLVSIVFQDIEHSHLYSTDYTIQLNTFNCHLRELQAHVTSSNHSVLPVLSHVNALLHRAVFICKAAGKVSPPTPGEALVKTEDIAPGKNSDHQWRFKKTAKSPGRKRSGIVLRLVCCIVIILTST